MKASLHKKPPGVRTELKQQCTYDFAMNCNRRCNVNGI